MSVLAVTDVLSEILREVTRKMRDWGLRATRTPADAVVVCFALRTITQLRLRQAKATRMYYCFIAPDHHDADRIDGHITRRLLSKCGHQYYRHERKRRNFNDI